MNLKTIHLILFIAAFSYFLYSGATYTLGDHEAAVVTQFGKITGNAKTHPGKYFKIPIVQEVHYLNTDFHKTHWTEDMPTRDKVFVQVDTSTLWKIVDPIKYFKHVNSFNRANQFVSETISEIIVEKVSSHQLSELAGDTDLQHVISVTAKPLILKMGIELSSVELKITYPKPR